MQFKTFVLSALAGLASAQSGVIIPVNVGGSPNGTTSLTYSPNNFRAGVGTIVEFRFLSGNHTVTQSTFAAPCIPINQMNNSVVGFYSGFMPAASSAGTNQVPTYRIMINDTNPIWIYCSQGTHCQKGMVMVINENTAADPTKSLTQYIQQAASAPTGSAIPTSIPFGASGSSFGAQLVIPSTMSLIAFAAAVALL